MPTYALPTDETMEEALLGLFLVSPDALDAALAEGLPGEAFTGARSTVFAACRRLFDDGTRATRAAVLASLARTPPPKGARTPVVEEAATLLDAVGGETFIAGLVAAKCSLDDGPYFAAQLRRLAVRREHIRLGESLIAESATTGDATDEEEAKAHAAFARRLDGAGDLLTRAAPQALGASADAFVESLYEHRRAEDRGERRCAGSIRTGLHELDAITGGFDPGNLVVVGARPSIGKSITLRALALGMAQQAGGAASGGEPVGVAYYSMEMTREENVRALLAATSHVPMGELKSMRLVDDSLRAVEEAAARLSALRFFLDETSSLSVADLRASVRRLVRSSGVKVVVIDYVQLMRAGAGALSRSANREQEIAYISRSLKALAADEGLVIVTAAQLGRAVESRPDKRPQLSDLRESGSLEQDANTVLLLHRPEKYGFDDFATSSPYDTEGRVPTSAKNTIALVVAKQRSGEGGEGVVAYAGFDGKRQRLYNLPPDAYDVPGYGSGYGGSAGGDGHGVWAGYGGAPADSDPF